MNRCIVPLGVTAVVGLVVSVMVAPMAGQRAAGATAPAKARSGWIAPRTPR